MSYIGATIDTIAKQTCAAVGCQNPGKGTCSRCMHVTYCGASCQDEDHDRHLKEGICASFQDSHCE
jgi:hypothetical protein